MSEIGFVYCIFLFVCSSAFDITEQFKREAFLAGAALAQRQQLNDEGEEYMPCQ